MGPKCNANRKKDQRKGGANKLAPKADKSKKRRGKHGGKKDISKWKCFNCGELRHFACNCPMPNSVTFSPSSLYTFVSYYVLIAHSLYDWIADTRAIRHVDRDRDGFVDYHRVPVSTSRVFMRNGTCEEALGVGSYQLHLRIGRTLLLHGVLYVPEIQYNLLSVLALLNYGFVFQFDIIGWIF